MDLPIDDLAIYLHLARASERRSRPLVRDKLLVLASVAAVRRRLDPIAQHCRQKILTHNPSHLVGRWPSLSSALEDEDFLVYLRRLNQLYPLEKAEHMLDLLGIELARERDLYRDDQEYAAALLGSPSERSTPSGGSAQNGAQLAPRDAPTPAGRHRRGILDRIRALVRFRR